MNILSPRETIKKKKRQRGLAEKLVERLKWDVKNIFLIKPKGRKEVTNNQNIRSDK